MDIMNNEDDEGDIDDPLGDLGLDDFFEDEEEDDYVGGTNLPHRAGERICFVPVDKFQTMDNVASNVVPADDFSDDDNHEHKQQSSQPPPYMHSNIIESQQSSSPAPILTTIDKQNKNIKFRNMDDDNDEQSNHINNDDVKNNTDYDPDEEDEDDFEFDIDDHNEYDSPKTTATTNTPASMSKSRSNHEINANINNIIGPLSTHSSKNIISNTKNNNNDQQSQMKKNYISESNLFRDYGEEGEIDLDSYSSDDLGHDEEFLEEDESYSSGSYFTDEDYDDDDQNQATVRIKATVTTVNYLNAGSSTAHLRMNSSNGHSRSKLSSHHTLPNGASMGRNIMQTGSARNVSLRNLLPKNVSELRPVEFDICLLISAPLAIKSTKKMDNQPQQQKTLGFGFGGKRSTMFGGANNNNNKSRVYALYFF